MRASDQTDVKRGTVKFVFSENAALTIPKAVRELAFEMSIDVRIIRTEVPQYRNYKSNPACGFFGYAVLVLEDYCLPPVKLVLGRQRIYFEKLGEAYSAWNAWMLTEYLALQNKRTQEIGCELLPLVGSSCTPTECKASPQPIFREVSIRELYIKCEPATLFEIEVSWQELKNIIDNCGNSIKPKSGVPDDSKDGGLPPSGTQPSEGRNPSNPDRAGLPTPSTPSQLGTWGNSKGSSLNSVPSSNNPLQPTEGNGTYIVYSWESLATPPSSTPPIGFPNFSGMFLFDANPVNVYTVGDRCEGGVGFLYYRTGTLVGCAAASGYRLNALSFPRFF